jgi:threonine/homoserine/homoserine lactone efflux protein
MFSIDALALFITSSFLLGLAPGPDNLFVLSQSMLKGAKSGILITLGLCTGLIVHTSAVALGIAVIFQTSALAFSLLKYIGAAYLLYLAWQAFRASSAGNTKTEISSLSGARLYRRGIIMNITNPKVSIFFMAFLPQFADPASGSVTLQIMLLGLLFIAVTLVVFGGIALLAGAIGDKLQQHPRAEIILNRVAGTVFAALALKLATAER